MDGNRILSTLLDLTPVSGWLFLQRGSLAFKNGVIFFFFSKKVDCGLPGVEPFSLREEEEGAGWICNTRVRMELLTGALAPEMKESFHAFNSLKPSLDFRGKSS